LPAACVADEVVEFGEAIGEERAGGDVAVAEGVVDSGQRARHRSVSRIL
jgi:hypothetical protein